METFYIAKCGFSHGSLDIPVRLVISCEIHWHTPAVLQNNIRIAAFSFECHFYMKRYIDRNCDRVGVQKSLFKLIIFEFRNPVQYSELVLMFSTKCSSTELVLVIPWFMSLVGLQSPVDYMVCESVLVFVVAV